jgi:hypothetical protein
MTLARKRAHFSLFSEEWREESSVLTQGDKRQRNREGKKEKMIWMGSSSGEPMSEPMFTSGKSNNRGKIFPRFFFFPTAYST